MRNAVLLTAWVCAATAVACSGGQGGTNGGTGGSTQDGGTGGAGSGGGPSTGGAANTGGGPSTGGGPATGGGPSTGGASGTGGMGGAAGAPATGGAAGAGTGGAGTGGSAGAGTGGSAGMGGTGGGATGRCATTTFGPGCTPGPRDVRIVAIENQFNGSAAVFDATDGTFVRNFFDGILFQPVHLEQTTFDGCVHGSGGNDVVKFDTNGSFDSQVAFGVIGARGIAERGNSIFVNEFNTGKTREFDSAGTSMGDFIDRSGSNPSGILFMPDGTPLVGDAQPTTPGLFRFTMAGATPTMYAHPFMQPEQISQLENGNLIVADFLAENLVEIDPIDTAAAAVRTFPLPTGMNPIGVSELLNGDLLVSVTTSTAADAGLKVMNRTSGTLREVLDCPNCQFIGNACL